jgi:hypothetical protein
MDIGAILAGLGLAILVAAYVARPLILQRVAHDHAPSELPPRKQLAARRDAVYALIRELDSDYQTGKLNSQDYQTMRERYVIEGAALLKQLDALSGQNGRAALEAELEARVLNLRRDQTAPVAASGGITGRFCTQCGQAVDAGDRFCAYCGAPVKGGAGQ